MAYKFVTDKIEVRTSIEGDSPRYIVRGTGMMSGIPHVYKYNKDKNGQYTTLKSMFTQHCIESVKRQSKNKTIFVDAQHELAINANIKHLLKDKLSIEEMKQLENMLKVKELPLAKLNDIEINDNSIELDTELNPSFRTLDKSHEVYFDSVWNSLQKKFINGISVNFANAQVIQDDKGLEVIDDIDVLGFSYMSNPAISECSITEVAIRAIQEGEKKMENKETGNTPANAGQDVEAIKKELDAQKAEIEQLKSERAKAEADAKQKAEQDKQKSIEEQMAEQKKVNEELQKKVADMEAKAQAIDPNNSAKGVVHQITPPAQAGAAVPVKDAKFYSENLKEITAGHDATMTSIKNGVSPNVDNRMEGFGELVNLQAKVNNPTAGMKFEHPADELMARKLLGKGPGDIIVPNRKI